MFPFREIMRFMVSELWITVPKMNYALRFYLRVNLKATATSGLWECRNYSVSFCPLEEFLNRILWGISPLIIDQKTKFPWKVHEPITKKKNRLRHCVQVYRAREVFWLLSLSGTIWVLWVPFMVAKLTEGQTKFKYNI